ncbi:MAG: DUF364 domain-containing protein [Anaerolineae bacterium]|nr:DUF364 domain-containing protein [Anaerolineae bacterium]
MTVIDDLLASIASNTPLISTRDVVVGLYWTAVYGQKMGLAATLTDTTCCYATDIEGAGELHNHPMNELALLVKSKHPLEVAIGMAALNALNTVKMNEGIELNAREIILDRGRGKTVVTVGHFPFTDTLREVAARLWVLELNPLLDDQPAEAAPDLIPQADVIGLTASTLLNGTFDSLVKLFPPKAFVVMLGPSTPLNKVLFDYGVSMLAGALVTAPAAVSRYITQGSTLHRVPGIQRFIITK